MSRHLRLSLACLSHPSKGSLGGAPGQRQTWIPRVTSFPPPIKPTGEGKTRRRLVICNLVIVRFVHVTAPMLSMATW